MTKIIKTNTEKCKITDIECGEFFEHDNYLHIKTLGNTSSFNISLKKEYLSTDDTIVYKIKNCEIKYTT